MIIDEIKNIPSDKLTLKKFGITIGIVLILLAVFLLYYNNSSYVIWGSLGILFILTGFVFPIVLKPLQKFWMTLAIILGFVMTRVILSILFYLILTPIGFAAKLFGKKFLDLKFEKSKQTYWNYRKISQYEKIDTERQF